MSRYLNDLSYLEIREGTSLQWQCPVFDGPSPSPRESHAAVTIGNNRLLIYGGMNGRRLGDVWILDIGGCGFFYNHVHFIVDLVFPFPQTKCSGTAC